MSIHDDNKAWFEGFIGAPRRYLSSFSEHLSYKQGEEARGGRVSTTHLMRARKLAGPRIFPLGKACWCLE